MRALHTQAHTHMPAHTHAQVCVRAHTRLVTIKKMRGWFSAAAVGGVVVTGTTRFVTVSDISLLWGI